VGVGAAVAPATGPGIQAALFASVTAAALLIFEKLERDARESENEAVLARSLLFQFVCLVSRKNSHDALAMLKRAARRYDPKRVMPFLPQTTYSALFAQAWASANTLNRYDSDGTPVPTILDLVANTFGQFVDLQKGAIDLVLEQSVRADDEGRFSRGNFHERLYALFFLQTAGEPYHFDAERREPGGEFPVMLFREDFSRCHDRRLIA
jgi:hypothetical protein